jgi:DNA-binding MarR family transcriptional regulator
MLVSLTNQGQSLHPRVREIWNELNSIPTAGFSEKEQLELERLLLRVLQNLTPKAPGEAVIVDPDC